MDLQAILNAVIEKGFITKDEKTQIENAFDAMDKADQRKVMKLYVQATELEVKSEDDVAEEQITKIFSNAVEQYVGSFEDTMKEMQSNFITRLETFKDNQEKLANKNIDQHSEEVHNFLTALSSGSKEELKALHEKNHKAVLGKNALTTDAEAGAKAGVTIPEILSNEIIRIAEDQYGYARREFFYMPMGGAGNTRNIPKLSNGVSVFWTDEAAKILSTQATFEMVTLEVKKLAAIAPWTTEIAEDSAFPLTSFIATLFAEEIAKAEDISFFMGSGATWTGIFNEDAGGAGEINKQVIAGATYASVTADDLMDMVDSIPETELAGAKFYMHRTVLTAIRKLKGNDGQYIFQQLQGDTTRTILGYPIVTIEILPSTSTEVQAETPFILFGNLKKAVMFADKRAMQMKILDQATIRNVANNADIHLGAQDMEALRVTERVGYLTVKPEAMTLLFTGAVDES